MPGFIDDGYTVDGALIKGRDGLYEDLRLSYRPTTPGERTAALKEMRKAHDSPNPKKSELEAARLIAERLTEWDLKYPEGPRKGQVVEITPANVAKVHPVLSIEIWNMVIMGERASDETRDAKTDQEQAEEDEKNS